MEIRDTLPSLKASIDAGDSFISGGHRVLKTAGATSHSERMKRVPVWALDDNKIKELIRARFPNGDADPKQRKLASRMVSFIYLYYRVGMTIYQVSEQLNMTPKAADKLRHRIVKSMSKPIKPRGRPRKKPGGVDSSYEV